MGGGQSSQCGFDEMISATIVMGRAISAIAFPGMFRIYDFHSTKAPKLKNARPKFLLFGDDSGSDDEGSPPPDPGEYESLFFVDVGNDRIYLENPLACNTSGWTALHTCCMSFAASNAGAKLAEEFVRLGGNLDIKTIIGPGTFNRGWTPLHMACAYGVEPLVKKLLECGANPNVTNCFGYSPLLEACHRGFINIVTYLLQHKADCDHIPPEQLSLQSPFVSSPAQTALGEACRCGFQKIALELINAGASKNFPNVLGWTPLHEACFYNRVETVKMLLLNGVDASIRTKSGALAYHFTGIQTIRDMLKDMGGEGSTPVDEQDTVDMMSVLKELTLADYMEELQQRGLEDSDGKDGSGGSGNGNRIEDVKPTTSPSGKVNSAKKASKKQTSFPQHQSDEYIPEDNYYEDAKASHQKLLHSGPMLGDLPALSPSKKSPGKQFNEDHASLLNAAVSGEESPLRSGVSNSSMKAKKKNQQRADNSNMPPEFMCELCQKLMSDPVKTVYGNVFERDVIMHWFRQQGHVCPLTGAPLAESDLTPAEDLKGKIRKFILNKSKAGDATNTSSNTEVDSAVAVQAANDHTRSKSKALRNEQKDADDDLYDF